MATIIERNGAYLARVRQQGFKPVSKTFHLRRDAVRWAAQTKAAMQGGRWVEAAATIPTLAAAVSAYTAAISGRLKGSANYAAWLGELAAGERGGKQLDKVTPADLAGWRDEMAAAGLKPGSVSRKRTPAHDLSCLRCE